MTLPLYTDSDKERIHPFLDYIDFNNHYEREFSFDLSNLIHSPSFRRLSGKTQLLPELENEYFRNRLTHSLEVSDVAVKIAKSLNRQVPYFKAHPINLNLIRFAAYAHDLGHPPFGHKGEKALDKLMREYCIKYKNFLSSQKKKRKKEDYGLRFEGNAHNIRILLSLEKKFEITNKLPNSNYSLRIGLNPTFRCMASILKYDAQLEDEDVVLNKGKYSVNKNVLINKKGYFKEEAELIKKIKSGVTQVSNFKGKFRTIECNIMEFADDISYTVYDLEDILKGRFLSLQDLTERFNDETYKELKCNLYEAVKDDFTKAKKNNALHIEKRFLFPSTPDKLYSLIMDKFLLTIFGSKRSISIYKKDIGVAYKISRSLSKDGNFRINFSSDLVKYFVSQLKVRKIAKIPALTDVSMNIDAFLAMSFIKHFIYLTITKTAKIQIVDYRGEEIVSEIFNTLCKQPNLLPGDFKEIFYQHKDIDAERNKVLTPGQLRCICDYVASMTNRYAIEFYARLKSENHQSIFKPF